VVSKKLYGSSTTSTVSGNVNKESRQQESVKASDSIICLDDEIEHVNRAGANAVTLSSEEKDNSVSNHMGKTQSRHRRIAVGNKKFKCVKCRFRSNWRRYISRHFKTVHRQEALSCLRHYEVLDENEAMRTLADYEQNCESKNLSYKRFQCGMCEYRASQKGNAHGHMRTFHQVELIEAQRLVKFLPLDEAKNTVGEYNEKFVSESGIYQPKKKAASLVQLKRNREKRSAARKGRAATSMAVGNKKFKCVECFFRSNWLWCVSMHFKAVHKEIPFIQLECAEVLDEDEATRTLAAYDQHFTSKIFDCKPFKCGKCDYRAASRYNAVIHIRRVHKTVLHEAERLVELMPLDKAKSTVREYNTKFVCESGRYRPKLRVEREEETVSAVIGSGATV
jgi:hypothetical protein